MWKIFGEKRAMARRVWAHFNIYSNCDLNVSRVASGENWSEWQKGRKDERTMHPLIFGHKMTKVGKMHRGDSRDSSSCSSPPCTFRPALLLLSCCHYPSARLLEREAARESVEMCECKWERVRKSKATHAPFLLYYRLAIWSIGRSSCKNRTYSPVPLQGQGLPGRSCISCMSCQEVNVTRRRRVCKCVNMCKNRTQAQTHTHALPCPGDWQDKRTFNSYIFCRILRAIPPSK